MKKDIPLKQLEYKPELLTRLQDKEIVQKLTKLQYLILNIGKPNDYDKMLNAGWRLKNAFAKGAATGDNFIKKITFLDSKGKAIVVDDCQLITIIINSFYRRIDSEKPVNGRPKSDLKVLLSIGGFEIIHDLKNAGLSDQFLMDFISKSVSEHITENCNSERKDIRRSKIKIESLEAFKQALTAFKKSK